MSGSYAFSVAMSVYDGVTIEQFMYSSKSIIEQDFDDFELIIVLDGVTKIELIEYADFLNESYEKIKILRYTQNKGLAYAMNRVISVMEGDVFVRMDADDISLSNRLSELNEFLKVNTCIDVVGSFTCEQNLYTSSVYSSSNSVMEYPTNHNDIVDTFRYRNSIAHSTAAIRKNVFDVVPGYPLFSLRNEDTLLWLSFINNGIEFANIPKVLYLVHYDSEVVSRRVSVSKSYSDFIDRCRVIFDLGGSFKHFSFAVALLLLTITPFYSLVRNFALRKKNDK